MSKETLRNWLQATYIQFVQCMLDVLPDFPNCCYQVSGAVAYMLVDTPYLKNIKVCYGEYYVSGTFLPHGWVTAEISDGSSVIVDFAHLQFEHVYLHEGCRSFHELLLEQRDTDKSFSGKVVFFEEDSEYTLFQKAYC